MANYTVTNEEVKEFVDVYVDGDLVTENSDIRLDPTPVVEDRILGHLAAMHQFAMKERMCQLKAKELDKERADLVERFEKDIKLWNIEDVYPIDAKLNTIHEKSIPNKEELDRATDNLKTVGMSLSDDIIEYVRYMVSCYEEDALPNKYHVVFPVAKRVWRSSFSPPAAPAESEKEEEEEYETLRKKPRCDEDKPVDSVIDLTQHD